MVLSTTRVISCANSHRDISVSRKTATNENFSVKGVKSVGQRADFHVTCHTGLCRKSSRLSSLFYRCVRGIITISHLNSWPTLKEKVNGYISSFAQIIRLSAPCIPGGPKIVIIAQKKLSGRNETVVDLAKAAAQVNGRETSQYIQHYGIRDQRALIEIAKLAAQNCGWGVSKYIQNYGIKDQRALIEIAILAVQNSNMASKYIQNYAITDQRALVRIAKISARYYEWATSQFIKEYQITNQRTLAEIARFAILKNPDSFSASVQNYGITDQKILMELASFAVKITIKEGGIRPIRCRYLSRYGLSKQDLMRIQLVYTCFYSLTDTANNIEAREFAEDYEIVTQSFYKECVINQSFDCFSNFQKQIADLDIQILGATSERQKQRIEKVKQRAVLYFSCIAKLCEQTGNFLEPKKQDYFIKTLKHRNFKESSFLLQVLMENINNPIYFSKYQSFISNRSNHRDVEHLILPMIIISFWCIELSDLQNDTVQSIKKFLESRPQRASLRNAKGFLSNLLQALISLSLIQEISSEQKLCLLHTCFQFSLQHKDWEKTCKQSLDIIQILADMHLLPVILEKLKGLYDFTKIIAYFNKQIQMNIFAFDNQYKDFQEKYLQIETSLRVPLGLVKYANNLRMCQDIDVIKELQRLVRSVLEGTIQKERYKVDNNPHLRMIAEKYPEIFRNWQISYSSEKREMSNYKEPSANFLSFLREKVIIKKHFPNAPSSLINYLEDFDSAFVLQDLRGFDKNILLLCKKLNSSSIDFASKLTLLKKLYDILPNSEFKKDTQELLISLTIRKQEKNVLVIDTDDWQDLFLSGTEVMASCQRIDGNPSYNVCLMAYVLDGKNRMLAIKDSTNQRILARCFLRLLWDTANNRPALFQDVIYPSNCSAEYQSFLNTLADARAKDLGLELFTINRRNNFTGKESSLESFGSCSPYEYVDAFNQGNKKKGVFTISPVKAVKIDK